MIYDDAAYGAEVHHFRPMGQAVDLAQFPPHRLRRARRGGRLPRARPRAASTTSRACASGSTAPDRPLVLDAKVDPDICAEWLEEAFRGH